MTTYINPGLDASGNGNNWTTNNINWTTVGTTYDSMTDVPTLTSATAGNYAVMNPLSTVTGYSPFASYTAGNLNVSSGNVSTFMAGYSSMPTPSTGKFYWEITVNTLTTTGDMFLGLYSPTASYPATYRDAGNISNLSGSPQTSGNSYTAGDIIGVAVDATAGTVQFYKNNVAQGATPSLSFTAGTQLFAYMASDNNAGEIAASFNFGQRPFAYTPPTGYVALNTYNLPTPTIGATASSQANKYFDATLYTGDGSSAKAIVNAGGFQPDLVWVKSRSAAKYHVLNDSVRGVPKNLYTNVTDAEDTAPRISSINSNGFTVTTDGGTATNENGTTFVGWQWKANGTPAVTNTAGSITSTVSANTTSGFSIVTFTPPSSGTCTVGHGLGVAPAMIITKKRNGADNWPVYHASLGAGKIVELNLTSAQSTNSIIGTSAPTSTIFNFAGVGGDWVAYCFAEVAGYSKFGSYTGNGSSDGTFVYTGFRPKFVMFKNATTSGNSWIIFDTSRTPSNQEFLELKPESSAAESPAGSYAYFDFLSNGFKARTTNTGVNASGGTIIYMAFAENPFKYSLAR